GGTDRSACASVELQARCAFAAAFADSHRSLHRQCQLSTHLRETVAEVIHVAGHADSPVTDIVTRCLLRLASKRALEERSAAAAVIELFLLGFKRAQGKLGLLERNGERTTMETMQQLVEYVYEVAKKGLNIQRYKGLGEMNPTQLWETTMDPENRRLLQVTS
ncbi:MAG: hypothetical protein IFJ96_06135, partial [Acidobacteria bacterium]|nr:hypothetical protein [Candidatus Sulfomarinibacter sp. MAG AM2]